MAGEFVVAAAFAWGGVGSQHPLHCMSCHTPVPVEFSKLWINHGAVGTVQGFDHGTLDAVQAGWEEHLFAYPLWMYPFRALAEPAAVWSIDYCTAAPSPKDGAGMQSAAEVVVTKPGTVHAIMVWVDYMLTPSGPTLSTGPTNASG